MIEHVGHEYMEEYFKCVEALLAENGIYVLQVVKMWIALVVVINFLPHHVLKKLLVFFFF